MAGPITWQTVRADNAAESAKAMYYANLAINNGFDKVGEVFKQQVDVNNANWDAQKTNNTAAFMQQMRQYQTPEALAAAQASGALDPSRYKAQIDQPAVANALDARGAILQQREVANIAYNNTVRDNNEAALKEQYKVAALNGDKLTTNLIEAGTPMRDMGQLVQSRMVAEQDRVLRDRATTKFGWDEQSAPIDRQLKSAQVKEHEQRAGLAEQQANVLRTTNGVNGLVNSTVNGFRDAQTAYSGVAAELSKAFGMRLRKDGTPDFDSAPSPEAVVGFKAEMAKHGPVPSASAHLKTFADTLRASGAPPDIQAKAMESVDKGLTPGVIATADVNKLVGGAAADKARVESANVNNLWFDTPVELNNNKKAVYEYVKTNITDGEGTKNRLNSTLTKWMETGIELENPTTNKKETVVVPPKVLLTALSAGIDRNAWFVNTTDSQVKAVLEDLLLKPDMIKQRSDAEKLKLDSSRGKAKQALYDATLDTPGADAGPNAWVANMDARIASDLGKAAIPKAGIGSISASTGRVTLPQEKKNSEMTTTPLPEKLNIDSQPVKLAVPVPKGSTVTEPKFKTIDLGTGQTTPAIKPLVLPKNTEWDKTPTPLVQAVKPGGNVHVVTSPIATDGDGLRFVDKDGNPQSCRLESINAPEVKHDAYKLPNGKQMKASPDQAYGPEAKNNLARMVENKEVTITLSRSKDRNFCQVTVEGNDLSLKQVEAGYAHVYAKYIKPQLFVMFKNTEVAAKKGLKGMWGGAEAPEDPATFAHRYQNAK